MKKFVLPILLAMAFSYAAAADPDVFPLWPEGVPGKKDIGPEQKGKGYIQNTSNPTITLVRPSDGRPNGTAIIVAPGGGYVRLSADHEGTKYANWLGTLGVTTFVLNYRMQEFGHPAPLQDVLRAVRLVRSRAAEFGIDPNRIGVMGSSAGGHLAASAGTLYDNPAGRTGTDLDKVSARPDFLVLLYAVISMEDAAAQTRSRKALLGAKPTPEVVRLMSLEQQVTAQTPPTLLIHTQDDAVVPVENSILFYQALTKHKVPAEMYLFEQGSHGMGLHGGRANASQWPRRAEEWLRARGLLTPSTPAN